MAEDVNYGPQWIYWFIFLPMGVWVTIILQQLTQQRMGVTYFLSPEAHRRLISRRRIKVALILAAIASLALPLYFKVPYTLLIPLVLFPLAIWYERKYQWPFIVESYTASTLTLGRLPSSLVTAYEAAIASRRPKFPVPATPDLKVSGA